MKQHLAPMDANRKRRGLNYNILFFLLCSSMLSACSPDSTGVPSKEIEQSSTATVASTATEQISQETSCCVPEKDQSKVRAALVSQILGLQSDPGDENFVKENRNIAVMISPDTSIPALERIVVSERLAIDKHDRHQLCAAETDVPCKAVMETAYAEDYVYGYCLTMISFSDCISAAVRGAAYPSNDIKDPRELEAIRIASQAYR